MLVGNTSVPLFGIRMFSLAFAGRAGSTRLMRTYCLKRQEAVYTPKQQIVLSHVLRVCHTQFSTESHFYNWSPNTHTHTMYTHTVNNMNIFILTGNKMEIN